jgi:hypothetical protein
MRRTATTVAIGALTLLWLPSGSTIAAGSPAALTSAPGPPRSDFDGDGISDLAIGVPFESVGGDPAAGAVQVVYGSRGGLTTEGNQLISQDTAGVADMGEGGDFFGFTVAVGDFDGDGFDDLAAGSLAEDIGPGAGGINAGALHVFSGSPAGLEGVGSLRLTEASSGIADVPEEGDGFGAGLAAGDVNGDGFDDLAVGARSEDVGASGEEPNAGAVHLLFGSPDGISSDGAAYLTQDTPGAEEEAFADDVFGVSMALADLDGDGFDDLAIGVLGEDLGPFGQPGSVDDGGAVQVVPGSASGLDLGGDAVFTQDTPGIGGVAEEADLFGSDVAAGDVNGDGFADLAVSVSAEDVAGRPDAGAFNLVMGSADGLTPAGSRYRTQARAGVPGVVRTDAQFGGPITLGDHDGDGFDDLAIGAPGARVDGLSLAGTVVVLRGSAGGLTADGATLWSQAMPGVPGVAEEGARFGMSLAAANLGRGGKADLAIGSLSSVAGHLRAGAVTVLYAKAGGLSTANSERLSQATPGLPDRPEDGEFFGFPLAP